MTTRTYDIILTVNDVTGFTQGNNIIGSNTAAEGIISNVNTADNTLKVKLNNVFQQFSNDEAVTTTVISTTGGSANTNITPYVPPAFDNASTLSTTTITATAPSNYIAEKNAFIQQPLVRLYTLYYPGEFYPPTEGDNPSGEGLGLAWPENIPFRFAEVRGDFATDVGYRVTYDGKDYTPYPVNSGGIDISSEGEVGETTITIANFDNIITNLVEDPFLSGNNTSNSVTGIVNGETVNGIDPRTNPTHVNYDATIASQKGGDNVAWTYEDSIAFGDDWQKLKGDSRDLLGGVIEIKSTFANFLDYWPEYGIVESVTSNSVQVTSGLPYRVNDSVRSNADAQTFTVIDVLDDFVILDSTSPSQNISVGDKLFIVNEDADSEAFTKDIFKIDNLEALNEQVGVFSLTNFLQFFKLQLPKRKFFKNTCQWVYRGSECQYPDDGASIIPGTTETANGFFDINNQTVFTEANDECAKNRQACDLRNNLRHFGAFPGTGRTIPR